jgi:hypothetical protein
VKVRKRWPSKPAIAIVLTGALILAAAVGSLLEPGERFSLTATADRAAATIIGSGRSASKSWNIADFTALKVEDGFRAEITKGNRFSVTTSADDNVIEHVQVEKDGDTLTVRLTPKVNVHRKRPLTAAFTLPVLRALILRDTSKAVLEGFRSEASLKLLLADGSAAEGRLDVAKADFQVRDGSTLAFAGTAQEARLSVHDRSHLKLQDFVVGDAKVTLAHSSGAIIDVRKTLKYELSTDSRLEFAGEPPVITGSKSTGATIRRLP